MKAAEFVSRLTELATARGADAGPFNDYASSSGHLLEIYVHAGDEYHQSPGVYVWEAGCSEPNRIEPQAFDSVLSHVEALPINLEDHSDPVDGAEWPGASVFVWRAIMDGIDAAGAKSMQNQKTRVIADTIVPFGVIATVEESRPGDMSVHVTEHGEVRIASRSEDPSNAPKVLECTQGARMFAGD